MQLSIVLLYAKISMQVYSTDTPSYDNAFVSLGAFHIELSLFSASGKYIAEQGGSYILNEAKVIEKGSLNGFIMGKSYDRRKRSHQLSALAFEILLFKSFLGTFNTDYDEVIADITENVDANNETSSKLQKLFKEYEIYHQKGSHGAFGEIQYWMQYIEMIKLSKEFIKSIRVGNFELYVYCLPKLTNIFFPFNHINYARWLIRYHDNLLKLQQTHPKVYAEFKDGLFSIKRTNKSFSGIPIDLTLEQTINADAAC